MIQLNVKMYNLISKMLTTKKAKKFATSNHITKTPYLVCCKEFFYNFFITNFSRIDENDNDEYDKLQLQVHLLYHLA